MVSDRPEVLLQIHLDCWVGTSGGGVDERGDELVTDLVAVREDIHRLGPDNVLAIMTCTRCIDNL